MNIETAKNFAINAHRSINQMYDVHPYEFHLEMAADVALEFIHLIPLIDRSDVISGCLCHDVIEDVSSVTYNDLKKATNDVVADLAYACANEKGKTRAERANYKYYEGIRNTKYATFVKLCDRIANVQHSLNTKSRMFFMYKKEQIHFKHMLYSSEYDEMWNFLDEIFKLHENVEKYNL